MTWFLSLLGIPSIIAGLIGMATAVINLIAPILQSIWMIFAAAFTWVWQTVWWPGIRGALDGLPQILVVAQLVGVGVLLHLNASAQLAGREAELQLCRTNLAKAKKPVARSPQQPPLLDPFGWFRLP